MNYTSDQFLRLIEAVKDDGGEHLEDLCAMKTYKLSGPNPQNRSFRLPGCGNLSLFEIPYEDEKGNLVPITLCGVCDDLGNTPRYRPRVLS